MKLLTPDLLEALIRHDFSVQRARALLANDWSQIFSKSVPLNQRRIGPRDVMIARQLVGSGLINSRVAFNNYRGVRRFIVQNGNYLTAGARRQLLKPFRE